MLRAIRNGIVLIGVPGLAYNIFVGAIILVMLVLHALIQKNAARAMTMAPKFFGWKICRSPSAACMR